MISSSSCVLYVLLRTRFSPPPLASFPYISAKYQSPGREKKVTQEEEEEDQKRRYLLEILPPFLPLFFSSASPRKISNSPSPAKFGKKRSRLPPPPPPPPPPPTPPPPSPPYRSYEINMIFSFSFAAAENGTSFVVFDDEMRERGRKKSCFFCVCVFPLLLLLFLCVEREKEKTEGRDKKNVI